jgi:hypothetical protein
MNQSNRVYERNRKKELQLQLSLDRVGWYNSKNKTVKKILSDRLKLKEKTNESNSFGKFKI